MTRVRLTTACLTTCLWAFPTSATTACHVPAALLHDPCVRSVTVWLLGNACAVTAVTACPVARAGSRSRHGGGVRDTSPCFAFNGGRVCD